MTPDITKFFEGKEIRAIDHDNEPWFPTVDLAEAWGLSRNTLSKLMERNEEVFRDYVRTLDVTYPRQKDAVYENLNEKAVCVNERGLYVLLGKVSTGRLKDRNVRDAIIRFQRFVPELIQQFRKGELAQQQGTATLNNPMRDCLNKYADMMDVLVKRYDFDFPLARKLAMEGAVTECPELSIFKGPTLLLAAAGPELIAAPEPEQIPADKDFDAMFSLTKLAEYCKTDRNTALRILEDEDIVYRSPAGIWALTKKGEQYGRMFTRRILVPGRSTEEQFAKYRPEARDLVLAKLSGEQSTLGGEGK